MYNHRSTNPEGRGSLKFNPVYFTIVVFIWYDFTSYSIVAGFEGIRKAVTRRQNTVAQYIATHPILDLCERSTQREGVRVSWRWWDQEGIVLKAAKERAAEALATDSESESEEESETEVEAEP